MFPVALDFPLLMALSLDWIRVAHHFSLLCYGFSLLVFVLCLVPYVACVSGLFILDCPFFCHPFPFGGVRVTPLFSFLCWIGFFLLFVFVFVLCLMPYVACVSGLFILDCPFFCHPFPFGGVRVTPLFSFLCWIGFFLLFVFVFVLCLMPYVACVSGLFILDCPFFCHPFPFGGVRVTPLFSFLCWIGFFLLFVFVFVLCLMPNGACVSGLSILGCPLFCHPWLW